MATPGRGWKVRVERRKGGYFDAQMPSIFPCPNPLFSFFPRAPGTSTFDGAAIATAVLAYLSHSVRCMTLFSTHYHNLVEEFTQDDDVALRHMACIVDPGATHSSLLSYISVVIHTYAVHSLVAHNVLIVL